MKILAIDPGTANIGLAVILEEQGRFRLVHSEHFARRPRQSVGELMLTVRETMQVWHTSALDPWGQIAPVDLVACESAHFRPGFGRSGLNIAECVGMVRAWSAEASIEFTTIEPAEWKKAVTGIGTPSYSLVKAALAPQIRLPNIQTITEHELAAISIGICAARKLATASAIAKAVGK